MTISTSKSHLQAGFRTIHNKLHLKPTMAKRLSRDEYKVAWICPLEVEQIAAMEMLDEEHEALPQSATDHNVYSLGSINGHNVVIAGLHQTGNCPAATVVTQMRMTFQNLRFGLLVGIGGGVPVQTDEGMIRLGHVVVSKPTGEHSGAVQYDHGKAKDGQFQRTGALAPPPAALLNAAQALAVQRARVENDPVQQNVKRIDTSRRRLRRFQFPGAANDHLYQSQHRHLQTGVSCSIGGCDPLQRIPRASDDEDETYVTVHRGIIASGELVIKDATLRDALAQQYELLCFEMEAAGVLADFPCIVVRGISDYCDSHKNDQWHGYAAAVAAAYARQLFFHMPVEEPQRGHVVVANPTLTTFTLGFRLPGVTGVNDFVARGEELGLMHNALKWTGERHTVVLHGLGGMGKTQLTIAYAKRHRSDYSAVVWLNARDETSLKQSFHQTAQRILREHPSVAYLQIAITNRDFNEVTEAVKRWLDEPGNDRWLVIYDNYDDVRLDGRGGADQSVRCVTESGYDSGKSRQPKEADSKAYDIRPFFPETDLGGAIIITTRSSKVKLGQLIRLNPGAEALAKQLDGLPLALSTAGAYLNQVSTTCVEYLQLYKESWLRLQKESPQLLEYDQALYSTWEVSFRHIQQQSQGAAMLLKLWAYFDKEDIWYELLKGGLMKPAWLHDVTETKFNFNTAMRVLCEHGLVEADPPTKKPGVGSLGYSVHGCVHTWMIHILNTGVDEEMAWTAMICVASHIPRDNEHNYWLVQQRLLQHADQCVTDTATEEEKAWVFYKLGILYASQDRLRDAETMYKRALQGYEKAWGLDHTSTLNTVNNLGLIYADQDRLKDAETMYKRALQGYEKAWGPDHTSTLNTVNNLGNLYADQDRLKDAETMYKRALQGKEKAWGLDHTSTLDTVNNLGALYAKQGRLKDAEAMHKRALQGYEKAWGPDHTSTLNTVNNLGNLYAGQGHLKDAETMYKRALQGKENTWGPDHTSTLTTINNLGSLYAGQGRLKDAETMYKRALQGFEMTVGKDIVNKYVPALTTLANLGSLFKELGEPGKAVSYYQRAQTGFLSVFGPQSERYTSISRKISLLQPSAQETPDSPSLVETAGRGRKAKRRRLRGKHKDTTSD
ncbi:NB-ARC and TPR domain protein [Colletotrichum tofieldiae]|uniref:NB-ARC and TPR domain protein n=1 Tax=Colletotrichum tofieldiae TaxID=708197 RepID=A0A166S125_9PEZI|nr:NB-ARC and TPR domain protein [Colletotrichum tofieldiae]